MDPVGERPYLCLLKVVDLIKLLLQQRGKLAFVVRVPCVRCGASLWICETLVPYLELIAFELASKPVKRVREQWVALPCNSQAGTAISMLLARPLKRVADTGVLVLFVVVQLSAFVLHNPFRPFH